MARVKLQVGVAAVFAVLAIVTVRWPGWVEGLLGVDPDAGSGSLEAAIVVIFGVVALATLLARRGRRAVRRPDVRGLERPGAE